jgi:hypothetical protein
VSDPFAPTNITATRWLACGSNAAASSSPPKALIPIVRATNNPDSIPSDDFIAVSYVMLGLDITLTAGSERRNGSPLGDRRRAFPRREKFEARIASVRRNLYALRSSRCASF